MVLKIIIINYDVTHLKDHTGKKHQNIKSNICACIQSRFSRVTLCHPIGSSLPGFSVHGILQARILEWVHMPSSRDSS